MTDNQVLYDNLDEFLTSVEKRAFVMAKMATQDTDTALDIVQDAMFRMVKNYASRPNEQWAPLFFKVLNNRITDQHRRRGFDRLIRWFGERGSEDSTTAEAVEQLPTSEQSPDARVESSQLGSRITEALMTLSERQRQAFMLREWQGLSVADAAVAMGVSQGSVKTHLWRANQALQLELQEYRKS